MKKLSKIMTVSVFSALTGMTSSAIAGGFGIATQSGSGTGNAFAGGAAVAEDASVAWSNPAAMTLLPSGKQFAIAGNFLKPSFKYSNGSSTGAFALPGTGDGGDGGSWALIPNGFFTMEINPSLRFGVALNAPFGLKTEYDAGWRGQLVAQKSEIKTVNINPSLSYKVSDKVSIGGGVSWQQIKAELSAFTGSAAGGNLTLTADDTAYGFNLGMLVQATPDTRFGLTYRSSIKYTLEGDAKFSGTSGALLGSRVNADLTMPESASASVFTALTPKWDLMGDITWTRWSQVQQLDVIRVTARLAPGGAAGTTLTSLPFKWGDTFRLAVGANYKWSNKSKLRLGMAYDKTPSKDETRTPRLPDQDRFWLAAGVQYRVSKSGMLELGYAHEFIRDASVNVAVPLAGTLSGKFANQADILSIQYSHSF